MTTPTRNDLIDESREIVIAILDGALHQGLTKAEFAKAAGITPQFVSQVMAGNRMLSEPTAAMVAARLVQLKVIAEGEADRWLHYVNAYWRLRRALADDAIERGRGEPGAFLTELRALHGQATHSGDPEATARAYRRAADIGEAASVWPDSEAPVLARIETCLILHDVYSVLGRHADAYWASTRCIWLCDAVDRSSLGDDVQALDTFSMNGRRSRIVTLNNVGLVRKAYALSFGLESEPAFRQRPDEWKPHVFRDRLSSLSRLSRFAISEAEGLADQVVRICERRGGSQDQLLALMISRSLARTLTVAGRSDKAGRILSRWLSSIDDVPGIGALHKVQFLRACAESAWSLKNFTEWREYASRASQLAKHAGLTHQYEELQRHISAHDPARAS